MCSRCRWSSTTTCQTTVSCTSTGGSYACNLCVRVRVRAPLYAHVVLQERFIPQLIQRQLGNPCKSESSRPYSWSLESTRCKPWYSSNNWHATNNFQVHKFTLTHTCTYACMHIHKNPTAHTYTYIHTHRVHAPRIQTHAHKFKHSVYIPHTTYTHTHAHIFTYSAYTQHATRTHRIGRSGRFGRKGVSINFVRNDDIRILRDIEQYYSTQVCVRVYFCTCVCVCNGMSWWLKLGFRVYSAAGINSVIPVLINRVGQIRTYMYTHTEYLVISKPKNTMV